MESEPISQKWIRHALLVSFSYFVMVAIIGTLLRLSTLYPILSNYSNILHTHSHTAFMGWVYNSVYIFIIYSFKINGRWVKNLFIAFQVAVLGMMISFPFQGYGAVSIAFSTLHIVFAIIFLSKTFRVLKDKTPGGKWIRVGFVLMAISSLGPFALGPLSALGYKDTIWYDLSIQYYLHFFYNGWFLFALFGIFTQQNKVENRRAFYWLCASIIPLFFTSVMVYDQSWWVRILSIIGSVSYAIGSIFLFLKLKLPKSGTQNKLLTYTVLISLGLKCAFQLMINIPGIDLWVASQHHLVVGFIHLTFLGLITPLILLLFNRLAPISLIGLGIFIVGYAVTELSLFLSFLGNPLLLEVLIGGAFFLLLGISWMCVSWRKTSLSMHIIG